MFGLFKKNKKKAKTGPLLVDLEGNPLTEGDLVISHRYDLAKCRIINTENGIEYESLESGEKVSWIRMIDAATERQKVSKILQE